MDLSCDVDESLMQLEPVIELELLFCCPTSSCICSFKEQAAFVLSKKNIF